MATIA